MAALRFSQWNLSCCNCSFCHRNVVRSWSFRCLFFAIGFVWIRYVMIFIGFPMDWDNRLDDGRSSSLLRLACIDLPWKNDQNKEDRPLMPPKVVVDPIYAREHDRIDHGIGSVERCAAFGLKPTKQRRNRQQRRRLFFGSNVADESWQTLQIHSTEVYNVYHTVVLMESNTTHTATPRTMRYHGNTDRERILRYGDMFGNETDVVIGYWMDDRPKLLEADREHEQMHGVVQLWKEAGMTEDDIGVISDLDEVVSRDFLRALQVCDFPQFRPGQSCQKPKLCLASMQFEGSPLCIKKNLWFHPDVISGQCIDGIGDPSERVIPLRSHQRQYGIRVKEYGKSDSNIFPQHVLDSGKFPLWTARDVRAVEGCASGLTNYKDRPGHDDKAVFAVAYHLHNWFEDLHVLRNKYVTYSHPSPRAAHAKLSQLEGDVDLMVRCARGLGNDINPKGRDYYFSKEMGPIPNNTLGGNRPIYFLNETYVRERHTQLQQIVAEDEKEYGTEYPDDGEKKES